jgi:hypothetical protein
MAEEVIRYGAGGVPYVGGQTTKVPESKTEEVVEKVVEEPQVTVTVTEDDRPLTDEQVINKVTGKK